MQKRNRLPKRRTVWGAFYDHIPSHSPVRRGWKQWKNKRRKVSFPEQKGPEIAKNDLKKLSVSIWDVETASSRLDTLTTSGVKFALLRHFLLPMAQARKFFHKEQKMFIVIRQSRPGEVNIAGAVLFQFV